MAPYPDRPEAAEPLVTTVEESPWKAQIEPYSAAPDMSMPPGVIGCVFCTNTKFRRSKVRFHDIGELLMLRYPMRCMRCNQRQYGYLLTAAFALPPRSHNTRVDRGRETWKAWTESEREGHSLQRPMTTSIGTRATKLQPPPSRTAAQRPKDGTNTPGDRQIW